jgi:putative superfamily III holin-X
VPGRADGVAAEVHEVVERTRSLARLEVELATFELRQKAASLGAGAAVLAVAAVLALYAVGFLLATVAAALATALPAWLAILLVATGLVLVTAVAVVIGVSLLRRGAPPVPEQAVEEAKLTAVAVRGNGRG